MNKKKIIGLAGAVVVCILVFVFIVIRGKSPNPAENPVEMLGRIENALEDTLLENIRMGTDATEEQVRQAAKAAQIDDFIMSLPKGYATRIGDEGVKLSGGQQQRISIARAILKDAPIVVFDEATSYSDIENEHKIQLALQNLLRGKTTIMIAHRLHTIRNADKIVVFQDGKVVEQGTHDELIASGSIYSHMWDIYTRETIGEE